jgi:hypothetical protein
MFLQEPAAVTAELAVEEAAVDHLFGGGIKEEVVAQSSLLLTKLLEGGFGRLPAKARFRGSDFSTYRDSLARRRALTAFCRALIERMPDRESASARYWEDQFSVLEVRFDKANQALLETEIS